MRTNVTVKQMLDSESRKLYGKSYKILDSARAKIVRTSLLQQMKQTTKRLKTLKSKRRFK